MGKGVKIAVRTKKLQGILDDFWNDPDNRMESRVYDMCRELSLYGEIFVHFFVNRFDNTMKARMIDPSIIDQMEADLDDIETQLRYHWRPIGLIRGRTRIQRYTEKLKTCAICISSPFAPISAEQYFCHFISKTTEYYIGYWNLFLSPIS